METLAKQLAAAGLGLTAEEVVVVRPGASWIGIGRRACHRISAALPEATVEHIGSTAIPGLLAKPILDVAAGLVTPVDRADLKRRLAPLGLEFVKDLRDEGGLLFRVEVAPNRFGLHLHCVSRHDPQWTEYLSLRARLRESGELRLRYATLKTQLANRHADNREGYTGAKAAFIRSALAG